MFTPNVEEYMQSPKVLEDYFKREGYVSMKHFTLLRIKRRCDESTDLKLTYPGSPLFTKQFMSTNAFLCNKRYRQPLLTLSRNIPLYLQSKNQAGGGDHQLETFCC